LIVEQRRQLAKLVNSPPGFGARGGGPFWLQRLYELNGEPGFRKSITAKEDFAAIDALASSDQNGSRSYLGQWKLLDTTPSIIAAKPNPALPEECADAPTGAACPAGCMGMEARWNQNEPE
jgi:hypothetical protein